MIRTLLGRTKLIVGLTDRSCKRREMPFKPDGAEARVIAVADMVKGSSTTGMLSRNTERVTFGGNSGVCLRNAPFVL